MKGAKPRTPPRVLHVGKYYPPYRGGMETHLLALCTALRDEVELEVLVANEGRETLREEVDGVPVTRLGTVARLASTPFTPGFVGDEDLRRVVAGASALVLPSRDEGFGLTVLEALAAGTPVVASDLPVLREVGGTTVAYAPVGDVEGFATALSAVLDVPADPAVLRAQAAGFTWQRSAEGHRAAYALASS